MSPNDNDIRLEILKELHEFYKEKTVHDGINVDHIAVKYNIDKNYFWNKHILYMEVPKFIKVIDDKSHRIAIDKKGINLLEPNNIFYKDQSNLLKQDINVNNIQIINSFINNTQTNTFIETLKNNIENSNLPKLEKETWLNKIKDGGLNSIIPIMLETLKDIVTKSILT